MVVHDGEVYHKSIGGAERRAAAQQAPPSDVVVVGGATDVAFVTKMEKEVHQLRRDLKAGPLYELDVFYKFCKGKFSNIRDDARQEQGPPRTRAAKQVEEVSKPVRLDLSYLHALASLHQRSAGVLNQLKAAATSGESVLYDVVIIGAGIHEQIFQNTLLAEGSALKTLTIERGQVVSETTTDAGNRVNSNSSVRSDEDMKDISAVPGVGNINNFPGGLLQLPSVIKEGLGPLGNFGKVATINRSLSDNPVLFGWSVDAVRRNGSPSFGASDASYEITISPGYKSGERGSDVILARAIVDARGIGEPVFPSTPAGPRGRGQGQSEEIFAVVEGERGQKGKVQLETIASQHKITFFKNPKNLGDFPGVLHSKDFYSLTNALENPYAPFVGKVVAVVGKGDSGKTIMEFLARPQGGPNPDAYGPDDTVQSKFAKTVWVGVPWATAEEYSANNRARYKPLGAKFPKEPTEYTFDSSSRLSYAQKDGSESCPLILPIRERLGGVGKVLDLGDDGYKVELELFGDDGCKRGVLDVDIVIFATSLKPNFNLYNELGLTADPKGNDLEKCLTRVPWKTVRKDASPYAVLPGKKLKASADDQVYFIGPGCGNFFRIPTNRKETEEEKKAAYRNYIEPQISKFFSDPKVGRASYDKEPLYKVFGIGENVVSIFAVGKQTLCFNRFLFSSFVLFCFSCSILLPPELCAGQFLMFES